MLQKKIHFFYQSKKNVKRFNKKLVNFTYLFKDQLEIKHFEKMTKSILNKYENKVYIKKKAYLFFNIAKKINFFDFKVKHFDWLISSHFLLTFFTMKKKKNFQIFFV